VDDPRRMITLAANLTMLFGEVPFLELTRLTR
jgi:hydroxypyruvate isomerase